jgi:UDP-3-O-[3-hydroxymyristoyl] N-acetylglucosamine deacetylase
MLLNFGNQQTIKKKIVFTGIGLHSGDLVSLEILPARRNAGITFERSDIAGSRIIAAHVRNICSTDLSTSLGFDKYSIGTVEHLMAAFAGIGIDNAHVRVFGSEIPILDGSSVQFVEGLMRVGLVNLGGSRRALVVNETVEVRRGDQFVRVEPWSKPYFECSIDFARSPVIGRQDFAFELTQESFSGVASARTFCHVDDVEFMRSVGRARGGSLENAVVVSDTAVLNDEGLRYSDEFVRHKVLDCVGDLALLGGVLVGKVTTNKSGHAMHRDLMLSLLGANRGALTVLESGCQGYENAVDGLGLAAAPLRS